MPAHQTLAAGRRQEHGHAIVAETDAERAARRAMALMQPTLAASGAGNQIPTNFPGEGGAGTGGGSGGPDERLLSPTLYGPAATFAEVLP